MESLITETRLRDELEAFKATAALLATQKVRYSHQYVPPLEGRTRKPTLVNVPVCEPPAVSTSSQGADASTSQAIQLTIKSTKPPMSFTISALPTSTISSLKQQLASSSPSNEGPCPPPESQRWILKGKAMGDQKLLKEFDVQDGSVINLMVTKASATSTAAAASASASTRAPPGDPTDADPADPSLATSSTSPTRQAPTVPSLTLSEPSTASSTSASAPSGTTTVPLSPALDSLPLSSTVSNRATTSSIEAHSSASYRAQIASPQLWKEIRDVIEARFARDGRAANEGEAQQAWEGMLAGCREWIEPGQKALIREEVGYSAMGGY
ncbi:hypothetical protein JCM10212_000412 [Sporobolomyces blumeae]